MFAPLIFLTIFMGVYPDPFLEVMHASVDNLIGQYEQGMRAAQAASGLHVAAR